MILTVGASEMIGTATTTVVTVANDENAKDATVYYINPDKKIAVKTEQIVPAMMNAKITMPLQSCTGKKDVIANTGKVIH